MVTTGKRGPIAIVAATLIALLASAATASAAYVERGGFHAELQLQASNGYAIEVRARGNGRVVLSANNYDLPPGSGIRAQYTTMGRVTGDTIVARFGRLGQVSVSLDPDAAAKSGGGLLPDTLCRGRDPIVREGEWRGRIAFHGERGYTQVIATHAEGKTVRSFRRVCGSPSEPRQGALQSAEPQMTIHLRATRRMAGRRLEFDAFARYGELPLIFFAEAQERREGVGIKRSAFVLAHPNRFAVSAPGERPRWAKASPPAPFKGWAEFREGAKPRSAWTGTLRTPLPGLGVVDLTGRRFRASLCEAEQEAFDEECPRAR